MPMEDARRWNARYRARTSELIPQPNDLLVRHADLLPADGFAIDIAAGLGANTGFLLARGLEVLCVDISEVALRKLKAHHPGSLAVLADLSCFPLPADTFDVVLNFKYLQRDLWPAFIRSLHSGGLLFFETFMKSQPENDAVNPAHLLAPGELGHAFKELDFITYTEGRPGSRGKPGKVVTSLVARKK